MKIAVCVKQVPDSETRINLPGPVPDLDRSAFTLVINPYDQFAVEEAVRIKEKRGAGEITAVTVGPQAKVREMLKKDCLAVGCDKAVIVDDAALAGADPYAVAQVLASVLKRDRFDLVLFGIKAIDDDASQVGVMVAELLGFPHVSYVGNLVIDGDRLTARREIEGGVEVVESGTPCVLTCGKGLNEPRLPSLPNIMKAGMKPVEVLDCAGLGLTPPASLTRVKQYSPPPPRGGCTLIPADDPAAAARELARRLHEEAKLI
ncbi:MAG TPA: electron transfer flavoprotein subunit beta/FixA family protein [Candidatus Krumholzibacteria bacterium]|nr:electron transfer flavoprotein subunit beta/FixA family protein [Candidatus Krumholzibacteria bacterium]HPD70981.1 electron transfer flavoprotein subunit beta/FixA family protein [Candidatus Krumholzibacteria bacterium]HRY39319.1 electron transfer flavoprotein subunit beta/FixA family protein [Candidatus Krumholzibacteria bacterium]